MAKKVDDSQIHIGWILRAVLIILGVLIICAAVFFVFATQVRGRQVLRDAKNVYIALSATEIEYYAKGDTIYDPSMPSGLKSGVKSSVKALCDNEGDYEVISFDRTRHRVRYMLYTNGRYRVTYYGNGDHNTWEVTYGLTLFRFFDE